MLFQDKVVIVTGSGAGIGKATALAFAREGAKVVVNSLTGSAEKTQDEILAAGGTAVFVQADVGKDDACAKIVETALREYGGTIDALVNAAGLVVNGNVENCLIEDFQRSFDTNVRSVFMMSRLALPYLLKSRGNIVNVASIAGTKGLKNRYIYSGTKGAVIAMSKSMAVEYADKGIRVNCVSPGTVLSPSLQYRIDTSPDPAPALTDFIARQPMGRLGTPEEIAEMILVLVGDRASFITGANVLIDGGVTS